MNLLPWLLLACAAARLAAEPEPRCPPRCLCFRTTVRCMFLQLEKAPAVPAHTTILDLRFNKIKEITKRTFKRLPKLNTLLINNNHVMRIENDSFVGLPELRYLYIYKNRIKTIESDAFKGLKKLEQLYIHFNKIEVIKPNTFSNLPSLQRLFLHNNNLSRIPRGAFRKLDSLRRLRLDSNALVCDCQMMWLADMVKKNEATTQVAATCEYPSLLQGKSLMSLSSNDFKCELPKLTEEPHDVDVSFGGTAYFTCKADGDPKPDIVWLHNSNEILPDNRYSILTDGTLMIREAQDLDKGTYECMAKNPAGEIKSRPAKMHYKESTGKLTLTDYPLDHKAILGSTTTLRCSHAGALSSPVSWTHNDSSVSSSQRYYISPSGTLSIKSIQRSDAGIYTCLSSGLGSIITKSFKVIVQSPPTFLERPRDQIAIEGNNVELLCLVEAFPPARLSWTNEGRLIKSSGRLRHNGTVFSIHSVQKSDEGTYTCHAENEAGQRNSSAFLMVRERVPPEFTTIPEDQRVAPGSSVEIPCHANGQPMPVIKWRKEGHLLNTDDSRHRISPHGVLYMFNLRKEDEGTYECVAENDVGSSSVSMQLTIGSGNTRRYPGNRYVVTAYDEAKNEVDKAINNTLSHMFGQPHRRSPAELMRVFRFPTNEARDRARAAEIYERALEIVWEHVREGTHFNLTEFSYENILSAHYLELLANLSGCLIHKQPVVCSDICFHRQYRTIDGTCNNLNNPLWGSALSHFVRLLPAQYENGFNLPIGWSRTKLYNGFPKPSARLVSLKIVSADSVSEDLEVSHMLMQWGQFLDHDLDFSMPSVSHASFIDGVDCATSCDYTPPCFPIDVPDSDPRVQNYRCMEFVRSSTLCGSGMTSVFFNQIQPREQVNQLTAFIDGSNVYGSNEQLARHLRDLASGQGLLRQGILMHTGKPLLPFNDGQPIDCKRDLSESSVDCFLAGDVRANEQLGLLSMHTLWMREHNRIAQELFAYNSHWSDDKLYHEARKIVGAEMQHITYSHWLPKILGPRGMQLLGSYNGYQQDVNPSILNVFATAALRFGHTLINPELLRLNETFQPIRQGNIPLRKAFFAPFRLVEEGGIDPLMRGLIVASAKQKKPNELLNSDLTEHLFTPAHLVAQDLAALNIQRGRDHALPSYNEWRKFCNLSTATSFADFSKEISDDHLLKKLENLYGHPDNVDLWVGGISEDIIDGAKVGPTFMCLLVQQFKRIRDGDRFWYENTGVFSAEQLSQIKLSSLGRVLCDNGDNITRVTSDVFLIPAVQNPSFIECSAVPEMQLGLWTECCQECNSGLRSEEELSRLRYRTKRSVAFEDYEPLPRLVKEEPHSHNTYNFSESVPVAEVLYRQEHDFDIVEQRIESIEELVERLGQAVKRLSRKVKKLEFEAKAKDIGGCIDGSKWRKLGESWKNDNCTTCQCEEGQITCWVETCPQLHCKHPKRIKNECCAVC